MRDVAFDRDRLAVLALDLADHVGSSGMVAAVADHDAVTSRRGGECGSTANAAAAAGNHNNLVRHISPQQSKSTAYGAGLERRRRHTNCFRDPAPAAPDLPGFP